MTLEEKIIAYRIMYYYPEKVRAELQDKFTVPDSVYDALERQLPAENSIREMIEVNFKLPICQKVLSAIGYCNRDYDVVG